MTTQLPDYYEEGTLLLKLARAIAFDLHPLPTILNNFGVTIERWNQIRTAPAFLSLLSAEVETWNAAENTADRIKIKSAMLLEEWLEEANKKMYDEKETLPARTELAKLITKLAGMDRGNSANDAGFSNKFSLTINLGGDNKLTYQKDVTPQVTQIDGEIVK